MHKFGISLAVLALISNTSAIKVNDIRWDDDTEEADTLASIKESEKIHGAKFSGISTDDQKDLIQEKTNMTFDNDDEFVKQYHYSSYLQVKGDLDLFPEPRPIGEMLSMINTGADESLQGGMNDEEDETSTLESIKSAEKLTGGRMNTPEVNKSLFQDEGNKVQNLMETNSRITSDIVENALRDRDNEQKMAEEKERQEKQLNQVKLEQETRRIQQEEAEMAVHFSD